MTNACHLYIPRAELITLRKTYVTIVENTVSEGHHLAHTDLHASFEVLSNIEVLKGKLALLDMLIDRCDILGDENAVK